jgi:DNA polymerase III subunit beta
MLMRIKKGDFINGLYLAHSIADRKNTMPVLANALIRSEGKENILCAATDLRVSVVAEIKAEVIEEGGVSLAAKHLYEIVRNLPGDDIQFKTTENNWVEIVSGKAIYKVVGMSDRDFPRLPDYHNVASKEIDAKTILDMIRKTLFSVSSDESRRHINGVYFEWAGATIRMVSTDGHRLSKVECEVGEGLPIDQGIIIPRKGIIELRKLLEGLDGTCELGINEGNLFIKGKDVHLSVKLVDAQFPPYSQVIPKTSEKRILVGKSVILDALRRISIMSSEKNGGVRFEITKNQLRLTSDNPDLGEAREDIEVEYEGEPLSIGFNAKFFIDVLSEMDEETVALEFNGELDPGLVREKEKKGYDCVIMPMRL